MNGLEKPSIAYITTLVRIYLWVVQLYYSTMHICHFGYVLQVFKDPLDHAYWLGFLGYHIRYYPPILA